MSNWNRFGLPKVSDEVTGRNKMHCKNCGEVMEGDGWDVVVHCPNADDYMYVEPDADPVYCTTDYDEAQED